MEIFLGLLSDLITMIFDCMLYIKLTPLKKENNLYKWLRYIGCLVVLVAYVLVAYVFKVPFAIASFVCMTIPSFILFLVLSKYKNSRFLVTFCFVDTITLIIAACAKIALIQGGIVGGIISAIVLVILCTLAYTFIAPHSKQYRELMATVEKGWGPMAISGFLVYLLLIFAAAYPVPLITRTEYIPVYLLICFTVLSFYGVFILLVMEKARLVKANELLKQQQHWHQLAYLDKLTNLANKAAYDGCIEELGKQTTHSASCYILIFDIDNFKHVNDTFGHLVGNEVLKEVADYLVDVFDKDHYQFFRIGGDEFAAIAQNVEFSEVETKVNIINNKPSDEKLDYSLSCGFSIVNFEKEKPFEHAFFKADKAMYAVKGIKKENAKKSS